MSRSRLATLVLPLIGLFVLGCWLPSARAQQDSAKQPAAKGKLSAIALSARIDRHISARWRKEGVKPSAPADDATFYRRVHLDLVGKIPAILDIRDFLDDDSPDKRRAWIDKLLDEPAFADHFANVYRQLILPQVENQEVVFQL